MKAAWQRLQDEESGIIAMLVAVVMTALIGLAALGTDVGRLYVERQRLSTVADAAALAGASSLPAAPDEAIAVAKTYLQRNNVDPAAATVTVDSDNRALSITIDSTVSMTFARVLGSGSIAVVGSATAVTQNLSATEGAAPLGVSRANWQIGQVVNLKMGAANGTVSPGNYGALALGKSGASMYEQNLMYGYDNWIHAGDWLDTQPGNMAGPTVRAVQYRINQDPYATYAEHSRRSPRLVAVPILEDFADNGRGQVHVVGFGMFFLEQAIDNGSDKGEIIGRFVKFVGEGESSDTAPDFGLRRTKLKR